MKKNVPQKKKQKLEEKTIFPDWSILRKYAPYIIFAITIGAFLVRLYRVGFLTVWLDEYMHINPALKIINGTEVTQGDINGIFLTWVITLFFKIFGISETVARFPSVLFGAASVPLIYYLGKKMYNKSVGSMAALLSAFSLYLICWSRIARNYPSFEFAFLLLLITTWLMFNSANTKNKPNYLYKNGINTKYLILFPFAFIFSFLNHQLTFFLIFALGFYILSIAVTKIIRREEKPFTNLYSILSYIIIIGTVIFFTPALLDKIARPILSIMLPEKIINWVLPDWDFIFQELKNPEKRFKSFLVYYNVIRNDFLWIYYLGFGGIITSFFIPGKKKQALFLFSIFVVPLFLMSFVFREPSTPNYLYYIYPIFIIYIASFIYFIVTRIVPLITSNKTRAKRSFSYFCLVVIMVILVSGIPNKEIKKFIERTEHGQIINKALFHTTLVNWKEVCNQVKPYIKKDDMVLSTWRSATNFYLERDNTIWFRQRYYDTQQRKYVNRKHSDEPNNAFSYEALVKTFQENQRGWFFADYYFDKALTDPKAKDFVIRNMDFHFNIGNDGEVKVFSWDHKRPKKYRNTLLIDLGKDKKKQASKELNFTVKSLASITGNLLIFIDAEGIDQKNEAYVIINKKNYTVFNPHNKKTEAGKRQSYVAVVNKAWLKEGQNIMQFAYNKDIKDYPRGFVIYNVKFQNQ